MLHKNDSVESTSIKDFLTKILEYIDDIK